MKKTTNPPRPVKTKHIFKIVIGDWSGDGHSQADDYHVESNKPVEAVREAYFAAKAKLPKQLCPEEFCNRYEEGALPDEVFKLMAKHGFKVEVDCVTDEGTDYVFHGEHMAEYVQWFCQQGDPGLVLKPVLNEIPMLQFYGFDEKKRHIGQFGYGMYH